MDAGFSLLLAGPPAHRSIRPPPPAGPGARFAGAGQVIADALLLGDLLGVDTAGAREAVEGTVAIPAYAPRVFLPEELPGVAATLDDVRAALAAAVDPEGRPRGPGGAALAGAGVLEEGPRGLQTVHDALPLTELAARLDTLLAWLRPAIGAAGLFVWLED